MTTDYNQTCLLCFPLHYFSAVKSTVFLSTSTILNLPQHWINTQPHSYTKLAVSQLMVCWNLPMSVYLITLSPPTPAIAPDFSQNLVKTQTLARQGGDVLIECKPRMSPRGVISWRKGKEALRESYRYVRVRPLLALLCFALRRGVASPCYETFARSIFSVTEPQSAGPANNLNCITRCALLRPPSRSLHLLPFPGNTIVLRCSWLRSAPVSALFTQRNWPFADRGRFGSMC